MTPGTLIAGRYRVVQLVGRGGMGAVYKVVDLQTNRARAIKLMLDHKVEDPDARERFRIEAGMAGRIDSPFVVDVLDTGVDAETGTPFIVMELLEGETLAQRLARLGHRPAAEVVELLGQLALALARMHARNVVHRDLKPSNVFLEERAGVPPRIKVLDLGVAKVLSATGGDTTAIVGSVPYMAPEQIHGRAIGPATDLYALGLVAFALLAGVPYWVPGRDEPSIGLAMRIADGPAQAAGERASAAGVALPPAFDAWFARATARPPGERFGSAREAVRALAGALGVEPPPGSGAEDNAEDGAEDPAEGTPAPPPATGDEPAPTGEPTPPARPMRPGDATLAEAPTSPVVTATRSASPSIGSTREFEPSAGRVSTVLERPPPDAQPRPRTRRTIAALALAVTAAAALAAWWLWPRPGPPPSPLARPGSVLACPVLEVDGSVAEWGWLGAAAGSLACERARVLLGGLPSRTRVPAELLDLRRAMEFDEDPYGGADARARALVAARQSDAYLDGRISRLGSADAALRLRVDLTLRRADTTEIKRGTGEGHALYEAVRAAMAALIGPDAIPLARAPDPTVADYARARDVATMLRLLDWTLALANNAGGVPDECAWFTGADGATDLASFVRYICTYTLGQRTPAVTLPQGTTPGTRAARARVEHIAQRRDDPAAIADLRQQYDAEPSTWGRSVIAATLSCLLQGTAREDGRTWARRAVEEPKNPTGEWCAPWGQLMFFTDDTSSETWTMVQWRAWAPWDSNAWWFAARNTKQADAALIYAERAYVLSPLDTNTASQLSDRLLRRGHLQAARVANIAARLAGSPLPVHELLHELLTVRFDASEARFGQALAAAEDAMAVRPEDAGWVRAQRLELAWRAVEIANVLGRASEVADLAIRQLVDPDPPVLDWEASLDGQRYAIAICAYASPPAAARCFSRLGALTPSSRSPFAAGARLFAAGDLRGAAQEWRPLVRNADEQVDLLAEAMVRAFTAAGEHDLAIDIEARTRDNAALFDGANMAMARAAQALHARGNRGDADEARRLARRVLDAWQLADVPPPILAELRPLVR